MHFEFNSPDPARSNAFFQEVFGWTISKWDGPEPYWLVATGEDGPGIDGGIMASRDGQPRTVNTVQVADVDACGNRVEAAGGAIVVPKMPIPGVGYLVYCTDPAGVLFGLMHFDAEVK